MLACRCFFALSTKFSAVSGLDMSRRRIRNRRHRVMCPLLSMTKSRYELACFPMIFQAVADIIVPRPREDRQ